MSDREPFSWIEIDMDGCGRVFGQGGCTAALGQGGCVRMCYGTFGTCWDKPNFLHNKTFRTLRICEARANLPKDGTWFPMLQSVSEEPGRVNIAGSDDGMAALGYRATMKATVSDAPYHDRFLDPYQAERVSGAAQIDEPGNEPDRRGNIWGNTVPRWPYYAGRPIRRCLGYLVNGQIVDVKKRHYVLTSRSGPGTSGSVSFEAADVLDLAKNEKAVAPKPSNGALAQAMEIDATTLTLVPAGIGDAEYPASGRACIGSEIVTFTRAGDAVTLTGRGIARTAVASHNQGDTFQQVLFFDRKRIHEIIQTLLADYTTVDPARFPGPEDAAEIMRWLPGVLLTRNIVKPTGVDSLIGELSLFGVSIWPSNILNRIRLKANRPVDNDEIFDLSDRNDIIEVTRKDRDDKRLTQIHVHSVLSDPTKGSTSAENYDRLMATVDLSAQEAWAYGETRIRKIYTAWLEEGGDSIIRISSLRLLRRFLAAPAHLTLLLDEKDGAIDLADVLRLSTDAIQDETGRAVTSLYQVIERSEPDPGHQFEVVSQAYQFDGRFGVIPPNGTPAYSDATPEQRDRFMFITANSAPWLPDGSPKYEIF